MATIITTTGISLYYNTKRVVTKGQEPDDDQMRQFLRTDPEKASAEANSLLKMSNVDDHIVFLHTKTPMAVICTGLLKDFFQHKGYKHVREELLDFQDEPMHIETTGLRDLINKLIDEVEAVQRKQQEVVINATAGFKAQVVYSTMIGMIYRVPVKYLYEDFKNIVTFNPVAVEWDTSLFLANESFFKWVDDVPRTQREVENHLKKYYDSERIKAFLTPPDKDNEVFLSYMGKALWRKFKQEMEEAELDEWPSAAEVKDNESKIASSIRNGNHHPVDGDLRACRKIADIDCVREIIGGFYEPTTRKAVKVLGEDIILLWADNEKASRFTIRTTAERKQQTYKVAQMIKEILEID